MFYEASKLDPTELIKQGESQTGANFTNQEMKNKLTRQYSAFCEKLSKKLSQIKLPKNTSKNEL